jgi:hypothetical protein
MILDDLEDAVRGVAQEAIDREIHRLAESLTRESGISWTWHGSVLSAPPAAFDREYGTPQIHPEPFIHRAVKA